MVYRVVFLAVVFFVVVFVFVVVNGFFFFFIFKASFFLGFDVVFAAVCAASHVSMSEYPPRATPSTQICGKLSG